MDYKFKCPKCDSHKIISMRLTDYTDKGHMCDCGEEMVRDVSDYCTSNKWDTVGAYGKVSN